MLIENYKTGGYAKQTDFSTFIPAGINAEWTWKFKKFTLFPYG